MPRSRISEQQTGTMHKRNTPLYITLSGTLTRYISLFQKIFVAVFDWMFISYLQRWSNCHCKIQDGSLRKAHGKNRMSLLQQVLSRLGGQTDCCSKALTTREYIRHRPESLHVYYWTANEVGSRYWTRETVSTEGNLTLWIYRSIW
jgi:hypothetical protein